MITACSWTLGGLLRCTKTVKDATLSMRTLTRGTEDVEAWKKRWLHSGRNGATFLGFGQVQLHFRYVRCTEGRAYTAALPTLDVPLGDIYGLSNQVNDYTVLDRLYDVLPFLQYLGRWGRDCDFKR